ncbi:MAG: hypothetical protein EBS32_07595 [Actinobacteria bacterium]|nr:hypothetical protein [Actinomycetota bacterium]
MAGDLLYAFRIMRLPLLDAGGAAIGRVDDIVVIPGRLGAAPRVSGFVATSQRRRIFVNANRISAVDADGVRLRSWDVDLHPFKPRDGERLLGADVIDKRVTDETVSDVALRPTTTARENGWEVAKVRLTRRAKFGTKASYRLVEWNGVPGLFAAATEMAAEAARLRDLHPSDVATVVRSLPAAQRQLLAKEMDDDRLADLLEELPENEQLALIAGLDIDRLVDVLEEIQVRDPDWLVSIAAQVFITQPPFKAPTGAYQGVVHLQRLLREPPSTELGRCLAKEPTVNVNVSDREVAEFLASYNLLAVGVCDDAGRLLGAITVDDVLDRMLPADWRQRRRQAATS